MRLFVAASLIVAVSLVALPGAQAGLLALPEAPEPNVSSLEESTYCTCDPIPIVIVVLYLLTHGPCMADAAAYDLVHSYDLNRERDDCVIDAYPTYECVGGWGFDREQDVAFVHATVRVCTGGPLPPIVQ